MGAIWNSIVVTHNIETSIDAPSCEEPHGKPIVTLQGLLAASHKYALSRLQVWCEAKLCDKIAVENVCSLLCQAHLYDAKALSDVCLPFVRSHYEAIAVTDKFGTLARQWPEVMLKLNLFMGRVREERAASAIEAVRKRKREGD